MRRSSHRGKAALPLALLLPLAACGPTDGTASATAVREELPNGATLVRYGSLPATAADTLRPEVTIGVMEGADEFVFGDVRGIEADAEGRIYVYDAQTVDVRVFSPDGSFLRRISREGEGPGEISESNGIVFDRDGVLWVHDHGKMRMIGFDPETGEEVDRSNVPVRSWAYMYSGIVDHRGRFWKTTSHSDQERPYPPPTGLMESSARMYAKWYDPATETTDSVALGEAGFRTFITQIGESGFSYSSVPFENRMITVLDPSGGFWMGGEPGFRIARLDEAGDTVMVIEAATDPIPVTQADRDGYLDAYREMDDPARLRGATEALEHAPETKPAFDQLFVDDESRLWVRRAPTGGGEARRFDVFTREGDYSGSVVLDFPASPYFPPRVRNGRLYTFTLDELDVPRIVVVTLPPLAAATD